MASYNSADILCPFYLRDDPRTCRLTCEGVLPGSSVRSHFENGASMAAQIMRHCASDYRTCPWAQVLYSGYDRKF